MNKTVKMIADYVNEIAEEFDVCDDTAFHILKAAAGGTENIVDWLEEHVNANNDECGCDRCNDEEEEEEEDDPRVAFNLDVDSQGRVNLTREMIAEIENAQGTDHNDGIAILKSTLNDTIQIGFGDWPEKHDWTFEASDEDGTTLTTLKPRRQIQFKTQFAPGQGCTLEIYDDGEALIYQN